MQVRENEVRRFKSRVLQAFLPSVALSQELRTAHAQVGQELVEVGREAIEMVGQQAARRADLRSHRTPLRHPLKRAFDSALAGIAS